MGKIDLSLRSVTQGVEKDRFQRYVLLEWSPSSYYLHELGQRLQLGNPTRFFVLPTIQTNLPQPDEIRFKCGTAVAVPALPVASPLQKERNINFKPRQQSYSKYIEQKSLVAKLWCSLCFVIGCHLYKILNISQPTLIIRN